MDATFSAIAGMVGGMILGAAIAHIAHGADNPYGAWLGCECWVRPTSRDTWKRHVIVAVSWRGAVCVRDAERISEDGYWIKKQNVKWRVRFERPEGVGE